jgi:fatty acyl-CoA reductase
MIDLITQFYWSRPNNILVYNCTSGALNPIRWGEIEDIGHQLIVQNPFNDVLWYPGGSFKSSRAIHNICVVALQVIPAYVFDIFARLSGKKPM